MEPIAEGDALVRAVRRVLRGRSSRRDLELQLRGILTQLKLQEDAVQLLEDRLLLVNRVLGLPPTGVHAPRCASPELPPRRLCDGEPSFRPGHYDSPQ